MMIRNGIASPNDLRKLEDLPPVKDDTANQLWITGDLYPIDFGLFKTVILVNRHQKARMLSQRKEVTPMTKKLNNLPKYLTVKQKEHDA